MSALGGVALLVGGVVLVILAAELFLDGALAAASGLGVSPWVLVVVVSGFELENVAAGIAAALAGLPDAAAGTFLGGATFLALGVAGLASLVRPIEVRPPWRALAWTLVAPTGTLALGLDGELTRIDGAVLLVVFAVAIVALVRAAPPAAGDVPTRHRLRRALLQLAGGLAGLTLGGELLGEGLRRSASGLPVSDALLGNTLVASSVEAEEVARVAAPSRRGRGDLGLANVLGTIVHFVTLNAGVIALVRPLELSDETVRFFLPAPLVATAALVLLLARGRGLTRAAGGALVGLYVAYVGAAVALGVG